jgi:hypothetical protein
MVPFSIYCLLSSNSQFQTHSSEFIKYISYDSDVGRQAKSCKKSREFCIRRRISNRYVRPGFFLCTATRGSVDSL